MFGAAATGRVATTVTSPARESDRRMGPPLPHPTTEASAVSLHAMHHRRVGELQVLTCIQASRECS